MRRYSSKCKYRLSYIVFFAVILICMMIAVFLSQLESHITEICEITCKQSSENLLTDTLNEYINSTKITDDNYVTICRDNNDKITSIECNTSQINELQSQLANEINCAVEKISTNEIDIPVGTLSGITYLSGSGGDVTMKIHQIGAVESALTSEFDSVGINQTRHRIVLHLTLELKAILPAHSADVVVEYDYLICETIIVGNVPTAYLGSENL